MTPSLIPLTYTWITVCVFPWYSIRSVDSLADFWSPLRCDSVDHISHTSHRPNVLTAYFLMRVRTQSVCSVKSTICLHSPVSCAVHSHPLLLTQNKDGLVSLFIKYEECRWIRFQLRHSELRSLCSEECHICWLWGVQNQMKQNIGQFLGDRKKWRPSIVVALCFCNQEIHPTSAQVYNPLQLHHQFLNRYVMSYKTWLFGCTWMLQIWL